MTPNQLVPGIRKFPDLEANLATKMSRLKGGCGSGCGSSKLAENFRERLKARLERDKWTRRP